MGQGSNNRKGKGGKRKGGGKGKGKGKGPPLDSSAAALGSKLARYGGMQGVSLVISNLLHAVAVIYVARKLGPGDLGAYTLLLFLAGAITQVFHLFSKPGPLRRAFGQAAHDDAGPEGDFAGRGEARDHEASAPPGRSGGVG